MKVPKRTNIQKAREKKYVPNNYADNEGNRENHIGHKPNK